MITNIEHNIIPAQLDTSSVDTYVGCTVGELGCWVDPVVTRILQTGVEHSRVPDVAPYLGIGACLTLLDHVEFLTFSSVGALTLPIPQRLLSDHQTGDTPYEKLVDLSLAALNRGALDYHLQLSILLEGARGVGKATVAGQVARCLGVHLLEVRFARKSNNMYSIRKGRLLRGNR